MITKKYYLVCAATVAVVFFVIPIAFLIGLFRTPKFQLYYEVYKANKTCTEKREIVDERILFKKLYDVWTIVPDAFSFRHCDVSKFDFNKFAGAPVNFGLYLEYSNVTDAQLKTICQFKAIDALNLTGCTHITDVGICEIANLENLRILYLADTNVTNSGVHTLRDLKRLHSLDLSHTRVKGSAFCAKDGWRRLRTLDMPGCVLTDDCFDFMPNIVNLEVLNFSVNDDNYLPPNVENLLKCKHINSLGISGKNLKNNSDEGLPEEILEKLRTSCKVHVNKLEPAAP